MMTLQSKAANGLRQIFTHRFGRDLLAFSLSLATLLMARGAFAQEAFEFNVNGPGVVGNGIIAGNNLGNGEYLINSISGSLNGSTLQLLPKSPCPGSCYDLSSLSNGNPLYLSSVWIFDDVLYTGTSKNLAYGLALDGPGLGLKNSAGATFNLLGGYLFSGNGYGYSLFNLSNYESGVGSAVNFSATDLGPLVLPQAAANTFTYNFTVNPGVSYVLDPEVATGYVFAAGPGDPNFASVSLPEVQTSSYGVSFISAGESFNEVVAPNSLFFFPAGGVSGFTVSGILPNDGLSPSDPSTFSTVVTFASSGTFDGTQTPITTFVSAVPELSTYVDMLVGIAMLGALLRSRRSLISRTLGCG